jgi:RNA recognition motif. (a.k.a. RRM, RBD, or RNP domain)
MVSPENGQVQKKLLREPDFLQRRKYWKGYSLTVHKWNAGQASYPNNGGSVINCFSPPQGTAQNLNFVHGPYIGQPRSCLAAPLCLQDPLVYKTNPGSPATGCAPWPLLNVQLPAIVSHNTPVYYSPALSRNYPSDASLPKDGCSGPVSNIDAASIANSTTSDSASPTPFYLTEPRGVHIGNVPFETSEAEIRCLVARRLQVQDNQILEVKLPTDALGKQKGYALVSFETRSIAEYAKDLLDGIAFRKSRLKVKTDQDWQTLYPVQLSTAGYIVNDLSYHYQPQHVQAAYHQCEQRSPSYPVTSATYEDNDPGEYTEQTPSANPEPDTTIPAVVDGSKYRHGRISRSQEEEQSRRVREAMGL